MWCCYRTNISHAAITNLNSVLVKWLSVRLQTKWLWVRLQLQSWKILLRGKCSFINFKNVCTIIQQSMARFFNSNWHDCSTVAGTVIQQSLARFFNSHGQDFLFFLRWQNFSTVMLTVEESCHVLGIWHMIQTLY